MKMDWYKNTIYEDVLVLKYNLWRCTGTKIQSMKMDWYKNTIYEDVLVQKYNLWRCTGTKIQSMKMYWYKNTIYEDVLVLKYNPWRCTDTKKSIHEDVLVQKQYCCFPLAYKFFEVVGKYVNYSFCFK